MQISAALKTACILTTASLGAASNRDNMQRDSGNALTAKINAPQNNLRQPSDADQRGLLEQAFRSTNAPSQSPTITLNTNHNHNHGGNQGDQAETTWADALYMFGLLGMTCICRVYSERCHNDANRQAGIQNQNNTGEVPDIPEWEALEPAAEDAPPVDECCPITLDEFDWSEKPVRIYFERPDQNNTPGEKAEKSGQAFNKHYNNKWYSYDALALYITNNARAKAPIVEPTTREPFTVADLRQAHKNTLVENREFSLTLPDGDAMQEARPSTPTVDALASKTDVEQGLKASDEVSV